MHKIVVIGAFFAALGVPSASDAQTIEDLLVEKGVVAKSNRSAVVPAEAAKVFYKGGTRLEFPDSGFAVQFNTQIQTRYAYTDNKVGGDTSSFEFRRARLIVSGSALHNEFSYYLQTDFVGARSADGSRSPELRDAWLQWNPVKDLGLRMGQYKVFVSRQENTSSSKLQFAERSAASNLFELGRQHGLSARYTGMDGNIFAAAGIFNGESEGEGRNRPGVDTRHTGAVTARYTVLGTIDPFEEGDVNYTEDAALNLGAVYAFGQRSEEEGGKFDTHTVSADASFKVRGFSVHGEIFWRQIDPDTGASSADVEPLSFYAQAGYFVVPKRLEVAARYAFADCDDGAYDSGLCDGSKEVSQVTAGLNYFFWKHNLKAQLNWELTETEGIRRDSGDEETNRIIFQLSSYF